MCHSPLETAHKTENIWARMKGDQPSLFFSPVCLSFFSPPLSLSHFLSSSLSSLIFSLLLSPRAPRVALPWGLAPNHPQLVGREPETSSWLPRYCKPEGHTYTHSCTHELKTHTHNLIYAYQGICCYLLASLHPRPPPHKSFLPRPQPRHIN